MPTLHFTTLINAPREKVWHAMLDDKTYREWTAAFMPGSHFRGSWEKGSKIQFLSADEHGKLGGMTSMIAENKPLEYISIKHLGIVGDSVEDTTSEEAKKWMGFENYTFTEKDGKTELNIDADLHESGIEMMREGWEKALKKLKEIAEK